MVGATSSASYWNLLNVFNFSRHHLSISKGLPTQLVSFNSRTIVEHGIDLYYLHRRMGA
jgi:hypothetical protein